MNGQFTNLPGMTMGMPLNILVKGLGSTQSCLIGIDFGNFIIIQTPPVANIGSKLFAKNHITVRYIFSHNVYAFNCTLLSIIKEPYRMAVLSYPESLGMMELRKHERFSCNMSAEVTINERKFPGIVSNISMGGCKFDFDQSSRNEFPDPKGDQKVLIAIHPDQHEKALVVSAKIQFVRMDKDNLGIGLQFMAEKPEESGISIEKSLGELIEKLKSFTPP